MKVLFVLSALLLSTPAVYANDEVDMGVTSETERADEGLEAAPPRFPRTQYQCVATNLRRQRFIGRDFDLRRAQREALNQCQRRSFLRCRIERCIRLR